MDRYDYPLRSERGYRHFSSRYGWNRPRTPGWLGFTIAIRLSFVVAIVYVLVTSWRG